MRRQIGADVSAYRVRQAIAVSESLISDEFWAAPYGTPPPPDGGRHPPVAAAIVRLVTAYDMPVRVDPGGS